MTMKVYYFILGFMLYFFKYNQSKLYTVKALQKKAGWRLKEAKDFFDKYHEPVIRFFNRKSKQQKRERVLPTPEREVVKREESALKHYQGRTIVLPPQFHYWAVCLEDGAKTANYVFNLGDTGSMKQGTFTFDKVFGFEVIGTYKISSSIEPEGALLPSCKVRIEDGREFIQSWLKAIDDWQHLQYCQKAE